MLPTIALLLSAVSTALAFPNGAPRCAIIQSAIQKGHAVAPTATLGYTISAPAVYTPGSTAAIPITIMGGPAFQGILAYVTASTTQDSTLTAANGVGAPMHVGAFDLNGGTLRASTATSCTQLNVTNEVMAANSASTVTQAAPLVGGTAGNYVLMWTPPKTDVGTLMVNVVVSTGTKNTPWEILNSVMMMPVSAAGAAAGAAAGGGAVAPVATQTSAAAVKAATTAAVVKATSSAAAVKATATAPVGTLAGATTKAGTTKAAVATTAAVVAGSTKAAVVITTYTVTVAPTVSLVVVTGGGAAAVAPTAVPIKGAMPILAPTVNTAV
ncbi:hypothetical protein HK101_004894, partial [Irineochytrium annulatum]